MPIRNEIGGQIRSERIGQSRENTVIFPICAMCLEPAQEIRCEPQTEQMRFICICHRCNHNWNQYIQYHTPQPEIEVNLEE